MKRLELREPLTAAHISAFDLDVFMHDSFIAESLDEEDEWVKVSRADLNYIEDILRQVCKYMYDQEWEVDEG